MPNLVGKRADQITVMKLEKPFPKRYDDMFFLGLMLYDGRNGTFKCDVEDLANYEALRLHPLAQSYDKPALYVLRDVSAYQMWQRGEITSSEYLDMCN